MKIFIIPDTQVKDGGGDIAELSMNYLMKEWL